MAKSIKFIVSADTSKATANIKDFTKKAQTSINTVASTFLSLQIGVNAVSGAFGGLKSAVNAFKEQEQAVAKLNTALKNTGRLAVSRELQEYASELQKTTLYGDEATIAATALLASFKNLSTEINKRAIKSAQNLATAFNKDLQTATLDLAKVLNEPAKAMTKLRRAGIELDANTQRLIDGFVKTGDSAKAQSAILDALEKQYGGMAEAAAKGMSGALAQLEGVIGDFKEEVGKAIASSITQNGEAIVKLKDAIASIKAEKIAEVASNIYELSKRAVVAYTAFKTLNVTATVLNATNLKLKSTLSAMSRVEFVALARSARNASTALGLGATGAKVFTTALISLKTAAISLKATLASFLPALAVMGVTELGFKLWDAKEKASEFNKILKLTKEQIKALDEVSLQSNLNRLNDKLKNNIDEINRLSKELQENMRFDDLLGWVNLDDKARDRLIQNRKAIFKENDTLLEQIYEFEKALKNINSDLEVNSNGDNTSNVFDSINSSVEVARATIEAFKKEYETLNLNEYQREIYELDKKRQEWIKAGIDNAQIDEVYNKKLDEIKQKQQKRTQEEIELKKQAEDKKLRLEIETLNKAGKYNEAWAKKQKILYDDIAKNRAISHERAQKLIAVEEFKFHQQARQNAKELDEAYAQSTGSFLEGMKVAADYISDDFPNAAKRGMDMIKDAVSGLENSFGAFFEYSNANFLNMSKLAKNILKDIANATIKASVVKPTAEFVGGFAAQGLKWAGSTLASFFGFSEGGYTGKNIAVDEVAGVVHGGEYVVPAWQVNKNAGLIAALEAERLGKKGYALGGGVGGGKKSRGQKSIDRQREKGNTDTKSVGEGRAKRDKAAADKARAIGDTNRANRLDDRVNKNLNGGWGSGDGKYQSERSFWGEVGDWLSDKVKTAANKVANMVDALKGLVGVTEPAELTNTGQTNARQMAKRREEIDQELATQIEQNNQKIKETEASIKPGEKLSQEARKKQAIAKLKRQNKTIQEAIETDPKDIEGYAKKVAEAVSIGVARNPFGEREIANTLLNTPKTKKAIEMAAKRLGLKDPGALGAKMLGHVAVGQVLGAGIGEVLGHMSFTSMEQVQEAMEWADVGHKLLSGVADYGIDGLVDKATINDYKEAISAAKDAMSGNFNKARARQDKISKSNTKTSDNKSRGEGGEKIRQMQELLDKFITDSVQKVDAMQKSAKDRYTELTGLSADAKELTLKQWFELDKSFGKQGGNFSTEQLLNGSILNTKDTYNQWKEFANTQNQSIEQALAGAKNSIKLFNDEVKELINPSNNPLLKIQKQVSNAYAALKEVQAKYGKNFELNKYNFINKFNEDIAKDFSPNNLQAWQEIKQAFNEVISSTQELAKAERELASERFENSIKAAKSYLEYKATTAGDTNEASKYKIQALMSEINTRASALNSFDVGTMSAYNIAKWASNLSQSDYDQLTSMDAENANSLILASNSLLNEIKSLIQSSISSAQSKANELIKLTRQSTKDALNQSLKQLQLEQSSLDRLFKISQDLKDSLNDASTDETNVIFQKSVQKVKDSLKNGAQLDDELISELSKSARQNAKWLELDANSMNEYRIKVQAMASEIQELAGGKTSDELNKKIEAINKSISFLEGSNKASIDENTALIKKLRNELNLQISESSSNLINLIGVNRDANGLLNQGFNDVVNSVNKAFGGLSVALSSFSGISDIIKNGIAVPTLPKQGDGATTPKANSITANGAILKDNLDKQINEIYLSTIGRSVEQGGLDAWKAKAQKEGLSAEELKKQISETANSIIQGSGYSNSSEWNKAHGYKPFADGGIVTRPTRALIGEAGYDEAVIPLRDGRKVAVDMSSLGGGLLELVSEIRMLRQEVKTLEYRLNEIARYTKESSYTLQNVSDGEHLFTKVVKNDDN